jgi:hypothetical protein
VLGGALVLVALSLLRQSGTPAWRTLYAEDGFVFLREQRLLGLDALRQSYAGYLHTTPRLVAMLGGGLPLSWASGYFSVAAAVVTAGAAAVQFHLTRHIIRSTMLRALLAAGLVLTPVLGLEVLNSTAYLLWPLTVVSFWVLLVRPRTWVDATLAAIVVFLALASQPVCVVLLPLVAVAAWRREARSLVVVGAYAGGALVQLIGVLGAEGGESSLGGGVESSLRGFGLRVFGGAWLGEPWLRSSWLALGSALVVVVTLATVALLAVLLMRCDAEGRAPAVVALTYCFVFAAAAEVGRGGVLGSPTTGTWSRIDTRYIVVPVLLLVGAVVILVDHARVAVRTGRVLRGAVALQMVVLAVVGFRVSGFRSHGPEWATSVAAASHRCAGRPPATVVSVPLTPRGLTVALPCRLLRGI